jgi:hypothetical protein
MSESLENSQSPPDELTGPTPRSLSASDGTTKSVMTFTFVFLAFGVITVGGIKTAYRQFQIRAELRQNRQTVMGTVTKLLRGRSGHSVDYQFAVAGVTYAGSAEVQSVPDPRPSEPILIRYDSANPAMNHPDAWEWSPGRDLVPALFGCFMSGVAAFYLIYTFRLRTVVRYGQPATARVENCVRNGKIYRVRYTFQTQGGTEQTGRSDSQEHREIGTSTWILYMPQNPRRNCLYPNSAFDVL